MLSWIFLADTRDRRNLYCSSMKFQSLLSWIFLADWLAEFSPANRQRFQSLLSWIFLADQAAHGPLGVEPIKFQSLLSWIFLADGWPARRCRRWS